MCARVVLLAAVLSGAVPIAAQNELDEKIDNNIADWVGTCKLRFIGHLCTSGRPQIRAFQSFQNQQEFVEPHLASRWLRTAGHNKVDVLLRFT